MKKRDTVIVRRATHDDAAGILRCLREAFEPYRKDYSPEGFLDTVLTATTIEERLRSMSVFVAVSESGAVIGTVGCAALASGEGHLRGMAVLPEWQGSGIARRLLEAAESELRERNCITVTLHTTAPLRRATYFYEKHGYRPSGRVGDFFGMPLFGYSKQL